MFHCVLRVETKTVIGTCRAFLASAVVMIKMAYTFFFFAPAVACAGRHHFFFSDGNFLYTAVLMRRCWEGVAC